jgi:hypothetical protein
VLALVSAGALAAGSGSAAAAGRGPTVAGVISTVAGGVGGPALATKVALAACGVAYGSGAVRIADNTSVRTVAAATDRLTTPAGTGAVGPLGDGGLAARASVLGACGVAVDHSGNLLIADTSDQRIRMVAHKTGTFYGRAVTAGHIYTVAGGGTSGSTGVGGPATEADLHTPQSVAVDRNGNLVIVNQGGNVILVVAASTGRFYRQSMTAGDIYRVAGNGRRGFSGDGGPAVKTTLYQPMGVAVDGSGNLLIADTHNSRVRVVAVKTGTSYGQAMTAGDIYTVAGTGTGGFSGDGGPATAARLRLPQAVGIDTAGNVVIADTPNQRVRVVAVKAGTFYGQAMTAGNIYTVAGTGTHGFSGDGGPAAAAELSHPAGAAVDGSGNLLIADGGNGRIRVVAASSGTFYGQAMTAGDIYTVAGTGTRSSGNGGPATAAEIGPASVRVDPAGNLVIADAGGSEIQVKAASSGTFYGRPMTAGNIYTIAGTARSGFGGDGGPATRAKLDQPDDVALDAAGSIMIADAFNNRVRMVAETSGTFYGQAMTAGDIYTVAGDGTSGDTGNGGPATAAELDNSEGAGVDAAGNLLIADTFSNQVRVVAAKSGTFYGRAMTAGDIYAVAGTGDPGGTGDGGPATAAEVDLPEGVTVDAARNLVITDSISARVRVVAAKSGTFYGQAMTAGHIYTVAGDGQSGYSGDGGPATAAELFFPWGVAVDGAGNLIFCDAVNNAVRMVAETSGTYYGQAMTAGDIYTVAGRGFEGFSGDDGPATAAEVNFPEGVAVNSAGDLFFADGSNGRVRMVTR